MVFVALTVISGSAMAAMPNATAVKWQRLVISGAGLAVDMPGKPSKGDDLVIDGLRSVAYRLETGQVRAYSVRAEQMPASQIANEGADALFNDIRDGLLADGTLRTEWSLTPEAGAMGRGIIIDSADKTGSDSYTMVAHLYLRDGWLYEVIATVPRGQDRDAAARRFLASARFFGK
jgi:hypothetical protein